MMATRNCLVGNRFVLAADVNGNLTVTKLLPGGAAKVTYRYSDARGGQFFRGPQVCSYLFSRSRSNVRPLWRNL